MTTHRPAVRPLGRVVVPAAPNAITGLSGWWDASDAATLFKDTAGATPVTADNDLVARISDKSGNSRNLIQATSGLRPLYRTAAGNGINGLSVLQFDGTDDYLGAAMTLTAGVGLTTFVVVRVDTLSTSRYAAGQDVSSASKVWALQVVSAGGVLSNIFSAANAAGTTISQTGLAPPTGTTFLATGIVNSSDALQAFTNGVGAGETAFAQTLTGTSLNMVIGARRNNAGFLIGRICEVATYDHALTGYERKQVASWLRSKWGI